MEEDGWLKVDTKLISYWHQQNSSNSISRVTRMSITNVYEQFCLNLFLTSFKLKNTSLKPLIQGLIYDIKSGKKVLQKCSFHRKEVKTQILKYT